MPDDYSGEMAGCPTGEWRAAAADPGLGVLAEMRPAGPVKLHDLPLHRTDCNTPVLTEGRRTLAFPGHYIPIGHTLRREGSPPFQFPTPPAPIRIVDDPDPAAGKWIESVWRAPDGGLYGWYHSEIRSPCAEPVMTYHLGALVSRDDGATWRQLGVLLAPDADEIDCTFRNGWFAGGFGDFTVIEDPSRQHFLIHLTSYHAVRGAQGIVVARYPIAARDAPPAALEWWTAAGWRRREDGLPLPIVPPVRGWRHPDPDAHWGPAVHFNRDLDLFVMLLNRTKDGNANLVQYGIDVCFSADPGDPGTWTAPRPLVRGGIWYPQAIAPDGSDDRGGGTMRFFLSGFSAWEIRFRRSPASTVVEPFPIGEADIAVHFGPRRPDGFGI